VGSRRMFVYLQNGASQAGDRNTHEWGDGYVSQRVGKKSAGRMLYDRWWNEVPQ